MNHKQLTAAVALSAIAILSVFTLSVNGNSSNSFMVVSTPMAFTPATQFTVPTTNGTVSFAQIGHYENATLANDTWVFTHLQLDSPQTNLLSDSPTTANLNITVQNSNMTITSSERLLTPNPNDYQNNGSWLTAGWLNYTVTGVGKQIIKIQFNLVNWKLPSQDDINGTATWPISVGVYIDGKEANYNISWTTIDEMIPYGAGVVVNEASSNVSIKYAWDPVPTPTSQSAADSSLQTIEASPNSSEPYILVIATASRIIVPLAIFTNRRRLESIILKRIKRKQYPS